jgi:flagellar L-ring protein precursor FlgH
MGMTTSFLRTASLAACVTTFFAGCATTGDSIVQQPVSVPPIARPANIERLNNGAIFQAGMQASLFSGRRKPRQVGDTLKVDISESLSASNKVKTDTSRENAVASKGPGTSSTSGGLVNKLLNLDATASGSDSYKGDGSTESNSSFTGQLAASVINVLTNGNLVVAGERSVALNGGVSTLRFSGIVDPKDLKENNVVASADVVNARLEVLGRGDVSDAGRRSWLQRILTNSLSVW